MQLTLTILNLREKILVLTRFQTPFVFVHVLVIKQFEY